MEINVKNLNPKKRIDPDEIKSVAALAVKTAMLKAGSGVLNIVFMTDEEIRSLNRRYLGHDRVTDVLAFPSSDVGSKKIGVNFPHAELLGDIAISTDRADRNAGRFEATFREEVARYVAHGVLHLAGFKDGNITDREKMRTKENEILEKIFKKV